MEKYNFKTIKQINKEIKERKQLLKENQEKIHFYYQRKWLKSHNKHEYIDFDDNYLQSIYKYFNSIKKKGKNYIGINELKNPLLSLGIAKDLEEIKLIMNEIDEDQSGKIEFNEFLLIIKGKSYFYNKPNNNSNNKEFVKYLKRYIKRDYR